MAGDFRKFRKALLPVVGVLCLLPLSHRATFAQGADRVKAERFGKAPFYPGLLDWRRISAIDEQLQKQMVLHLEALGYKDRLFLLRLDTPPGNVVPALGGQALPLSGLVVTHSVDGEPGRNNELPAYLREGYDAIAVDKAGRIFIRGAAFLRTQEEFVPNHSSINLTFDVNAERGERVNGAQARAAADLAEALQRSFAELGTGVRVRFLDHHDKGLKPGKSYLEAGPARDAANKRLQGMVR